MKISNIIIQNSNNPKFMTGKSSLEYSFKHEFEFIQGKIELFYSLDQQEELMIGEIEYNTDITGVYLGIMDGFAGLFRGKALEVMDRITPKELDFFLRDNNSTPAVEYYAKEFYEILALGEIIVNKHIKKKREQILYDQKANGDFSDLSFSEQIEYFEEFCSKFVYSQSRFENVEITIEDIDGECINLSGVISKQHLSEINLLFNQSFHGKFKFEMN